MIFSKRCNIYISRLCHDASPSVHLSVTFVHSGHRVRWILDIFACLDRWMSLLTMPDPDRWWDDAGISGGRGGMEKVVIVAISLNLLIFLSMDRNHVTYLFTWTILKLFSVILVKNALCQQTNYHIGLKQRHIVRILPTYKTCNRICVTDVRKVRNGKVRTA